jgi:YidC/Oxa1 family membrane protein insertase
MEKRALIAIVLMFFVLLLYNMFLLPKRKPPAPPPEAEQPEVTEAVDTAYVEPVSEEPEISLPTEQVPAEDVLVETPLYAATFSTMGGVLKSFRLYEYLSSDKEPVELVPEADSLPLGLALLLTTGGRIDLSEAVFASSAGSFDVGARSEASLTFSLVTAEGLNVRKTCRFRGDSYAMGIEISVTGPGSETVRAVELGWRSGLSTTEVRRSDDLRNFAVVSLTGEGLVKYDLGKVKKREHIPIADVAWSGLKTKYFFAGMVPQGDRPVVANAFPRGEDAIGMVLEADRVGQESQQFMLYVGPLDYEILKELGSGLEKAVDFGWKWIQPLSKLVFRFMLIVHKGVPNYGLVIILLSALTKVLFWPLTQKSFKSMRGMQKLQPELAALKEKYKNDPQRLNKAMMELYREHGVNPVGGCLPLLLQMPVFISLFNVLSKTIELRGAGFVWWIKDLSAPDVVATLPFSLPLIGNAVSVLPILMGIAMFVQQKMSATDPKQAAMTYMLPIIFTIFFFRFPSGLVLYWLVNNILTIGHQYLMARADTPTSVQTTGG